MEETAPNRERTRGTRRWVRAGWTAFGAVGAVVLLGGLGEAYARLFPSRDCYAYLGEESPARGPFVPEAEFGVAYRSWETFCNDSSRIQTYLPFDAAPDAPPVWAFFGNSFVQAPGMLADTTRAHVPSRRIFNLGRNEPLYVRFAQVRLLLEQGLKPERIFVILMPLDAAPLGLDSLASIQVTTRGAVTFRPRLPAAPADWLVARSALARTAWFRTGLHHDRPDFRASELNQRIGDGLRSDLDQLFNGLARTAAEHHVPVTIVLIPNYEQITRGASFGFQEALTPLLQRHGLDVCDPRLPILACADKPALFIPDKHFSDVGNRILLAELLRHLTEIGAPAPREANLS